MYCQNCGEKLSEESKFCSSCGVVIHQDLSDQNKVSEGKNEAPAESPQITHHFEGLNKIVGYFILISILAMSKSWAAGDFGWAVQGILLIGVLISWLIGYAFFSWYLRGAKPRLSFANSIGWLNTVSWILPPFGIITGVASIGFSDHLGTKVVRQRNLLLGYLGTILGLVNAMLAIYLRTH